MTDRPSEDKRYYFYRDQLVALGIGFAITSVIIFVLGIMTGRHLERGVSAGSTSSVVKIPINHPGTEPDSAPEERTAEAPSAENTFTQHAAIPPSDKEAAKESKAKEKIAKAEATKAMPREKETAKAAPQQSAARSAEDTPSSPAARKEQSKEIKPQEKVAKSETRKATPPVKDTAKSAPQSPVVKSAGATPTAQLERQKTEAIKKDSAEGVWTVQIKSSPDKKDADTWADRLKAKGYDAFVVQGDVKGQTWYRVRVGHFAARQEAEALRIALESKEGLSGGFLTMSKAADTGSKSD